MEPDEKAILNTPAAKEDSENLGWGWVITQCVVVNATGYPAHVIVVHHISDKGSRGEKTRLETGNSFKFDIYCGSGHHDYWDVWLKFDDGTIWQHSGKQCDVEWEDTGSHKGGFVHVVLHNWGGGWNLQCPVSDSCLRIGYSA